MKFEVSAKLGYKVLSASTVLLNIQPYPSEKQVILSESFEATPQVDKVELISPAGEKRFSLIEVPEANNIVFSYKATVDHTLEILDSRLLEDVPIAQMPASVFPYLNPSRYCQSDKLYKVAAHKFGHIDHAFEKVMAIRDWIFNNIEYRGGFSTPQTSAFDTITEQVGVCRDFAHLGVALCRAQTIPARYLTCYSYQLQPPDFHACFEAYLGGRWIVFDPTKQVPLNGLIKISTGKDAAENAFASTFGNLSFQSIDINIKPLEDYFVPLDGSSTTHGYSLS